jgi:hypothetical protein
MPDPDVTWVGHLLGKHHGSLALLRLWSRMSESDSRFHEPEKPTND